MNDRRRRESNGVGLIDKHLLIVAGKRGVGRSTVAAAIGAPAARSGLRAPVVETAGRADVPSLLGRPAGDPLTEVEIDRRGAFEEYLRQEVPGPISRAQRCSTTRVARC